MLTKYAVTIVYLILFLFFGEETDVFYHAACQLTIHIL